MIKDKFSRVLSWYDTDFEQGNVEFTDTLIVGEGSRGLNSDFDYIDSTSQAGTCIKPEGGATQFASWTTEKGFYENMTTYGGRFENSPCTTSTMTTEDVDEYVERDQHSITVRSLASGATKISLYVL